RETIRRRADDILSHEGEIATRTVAAKIVANHRVVAGDDGVRQDQRAVIAAEDSATFSVRAIPRDSRIGQADGLGVAVAVYPAAVLPAVVGGYCGCEGGGLCPEMTDVPPPAISIGGIVRYRAVDEEPLGAVVDVKPASISSVVAGNRDVRQRPGRVVARTYR